MTIADWRPTLERWSREWLDSLDAADLEQVPRELVEQRWLGTEPATDAQIAAAEARLGLRLPPSYRAFLATTNGWGPTSPFVDRLCRVEEVERFAVLNPDWVEAYGGGTELEELVQISDVGDSAVLLLNPGVVAPDGEWEAWFFATWSPDEERCPSFAALLETQHALFARVVEPRSLPAKQLDAEVKFARVSALSGDVGSAEDGLVHAAAAGHRTARILLVQLLAFQHRWDELIEQAAAVLTAPWEGPGNAFWEDLCPALARAARETGRWDDAEAAVGGSPDPKVAENHRRLGRRLLGEMRERGGVDSHFPDGPNEPFEAAVQRAKALGRRGRDDEAWSLVLTALPGWFSFRLDQLAPTPLIADPVLGPIITAPRGRALLATPRDVRQG
jgi:SMI1 / KNR4 family (SUKH-1)